MKIMKSKEYNKSPYQCEVFEHLRTGRPRDIYEHVTHAFCGGTKQEQRSRAVGFSGKILFALAVRNTHVFLLP